MREWWEEWWTIVVIVGVIAFVVFAFWWLFGHPVTFTVDEF